MKYEKMMDVFGSDEAFNADAAAEYEREIPGIEYDREVNELIDPKTDIDDEYLDRLEAIMKADKLHLELQNRKLIREMDLDPIPRTTQNPWGE